MTPEERQGMNSLSLRIQDEQDYCRFEGLIVELNEVIGSKSDDSHGSIPTQRVGGQ
jgi:hypothetical protein